MAFALPTSALTTAFDGPQLTSDGGLCWLSEADTVLALCRVLAQQIPEWRHGPVRHSLETLVRQRVFQIACGYDDQDDADTLRTDPLLKLVCGRLPDEADLASQPTLSRLENAVDAAACYRLARALVQLYLQQRGRWLARLHVPHLQLATLRLRLLKIGGWVRQRLERMSLHLASGHPGEPLWSLLAARPDRP